MLKKILVVAMLSSGLLAQGAYAEVSSGQGFSSERASACQSAKENAETKARAQANIEGARMQGYSSCECSKNNAGWICTVDASWSKGH